jgi:hypothetical protein
LSLCWRFDILVVEEVKNVIKSGVEGIVRKFCHTICDVSTLFLFYWPKCTLSHWSIEGPIWNIVGQQDWLTRKQTKTVFKTSQQHNNTISVHVKTTIYGRDHVIRDVAILRISIKYRYFSFDISTFCIDTMVSILY